MATKIEQASSIESRAQTTITSSAAPSPSSSKVSMFGVKSGFVIPKNKLSGSLVPIFRHGGKLEKNRDASEEESNKQVQRKTKWGADLTQDASVRRGRALAYQTRVEQITQQLKSGVLEKKDDLGSESVNQVSSHKSSSHQTDDQLEKLEVLELERREAIGEILKLNPSYKAPPDYKPLLKEAKVPVPLKLDSGKKFIGLVLGPGSNTQKQLEEETGAKIQIHSTKAGTGEKGEIVVSDGNEAQIAYEELYVHISADTFEKVDAAVALVELLVTPVSGNPAVSTTQTSVAEDSPNLVNQMQDTTTVDAAANQGVVQLTQGPVQPRAPQVVGQPYPSPWLPVGQPHTQMHPPVGFTTPPNSPMPNNAQFHPVPYNSINRPSFLLGQPPSAPIFNLIPRNASVVVPRPQPPVQGFQRPHMPDAPLSQVPPLRNNPVPGLQPLLPYPPSITGQSNTAPPQVSSGNQPTGLAQVPRPPLHSNPQPLASAPLQPLTPTGSFSPVPQGPIMVPRPSSAVLSQRPNFVVAQPVVAPSNVPATVTSGPSPGAISPASFSSQPSTSHFPDLLGNRPIISPRFTSVPPPNRPVPPVPTLVPVPASSSASGMLQAQSPVAARTPGPPMAFPQLPPATLAQATMTAPAPFLQQVLSASPQPQSGIPVASASPSATPTSVSGSIPVLTPVMPSMTSPRSIPPVAALKPQRPSSGDFTFQPHGPHLPVSPAAPRPSYQHMHPPQPPPHPPVSPQTPSYQSAVHDSAPKPGIRGFPNSQSPSLMAQNQAVISAPSPGSIAPLIGTSSTSQPPPRHPVFPNPNPAMPMPPVPQMGPPQGFMQAPQMPNLPRMLPPRPENPAQTQLAPMIRPGNVLVPNHQYNSNPAFLPGKIASSHGGNQVYDPFSPTSIPSAPQEGDNPRNVRKQDNDPEYEDLMASVGVS